MAINSEVAFRMDPISVNIFVPSLKIYAAIDNGYSLDYELVDNRNISAIAYNKPKPATPLKTFFLPVRENVTTEIRPGKPRIIIGTPNCDVGALTLLDEIYLDKSFEDIYYRTKRDNTIIISSDCFEIQEHCHCISYNINPYSESKADLAVILRNDQIMLRVISEKGDEFVKKSLDAVPMTDRSEIASIENRQRETVEILRRTGKGLPDYKTTGSLVKRADKTIWQKYSATCVSCGACTTICPTCTCFLL